MDEGGERGREEKEGEEGMGRKEVKEGGKREERGEQVKTVLFLGATTHSSVLLSLISTSYTSFAVSGPCSFCPFSISASSSFRDW